MQSPGTITLVKHSSAIVGSGTNFTMSNDDDIDIEGKYIKVIGNNEWYMIKTVTDDTNIILDRAYRGESAAGQYFELATDQQFSKPEIIAEDETDPGKFTLPSGIR